MKRLFRLAVLVAALGWGGWPVPSAAADCPFGAIMVPVGQSIQAAVQKAAPASSFCVAAGIHRLQSVVPKRGQRFYGQFGSVLSGARLLAGFRRDGNDWVMFVDAPMSREYGVCARDRGMCSHPAGLFIDGRALQQASGPIGLRADQFYFDRASRRLVLTTDPSGHVVEWAVTRQAFSGSAEDVAIEGLVIEKYANAAQEGAIWPGGKGWQISHVEARLNNGVGLVVGNDGVILDCDVHHNGQLGIGVGGAANVLISGNKVWANNTNGFDDEWEGGGIKVAESRNVVFRGNDVHHNTGPGLWCDENCRSVLIEKNTVSFNASAGIFYEISSDAVIRDNVLTENGQAGLSWFWGAEIQVAASDNVSVTGNVLTVRPYGKAIMLIDQNRKMAKGGYYGTRNDRVLDNRVTFLGNGVSGGASDAGKPAVNYGIIQNGGNSFDRNVYRTPSNARPWFVWGQMVIDFAAFRQHGQETHGMAEAVSPDPISVGEPPVKQP